MARKTLAGFAVLLSCIALLSDIEAVTAGDSPSIRLAKAQIDVYAAAYRKLIAVNRRSPESVTAERLHDVSREWLKAKIAIAETRADCVDAALEYLEREDIAIARPENH